MSTTPTRRELRRFRRAVWGEGADAAYSRFQRLARLRRWSSAALVGVGALIAVAGLIPNASATQPMPEHKITLCHRTGSYTNPYVVITVDIASITREGHSHHDGPIFWPSIPKHEKWGDIIPPFDFGPGRSYAGSNWPGGQPILDNHCQLPSSPTTTGPPTTVTPPTTEATTTTSPSGSTTVPSSVPVTTTTLAPATSTSIAVTTTTGGTVTTLGNETTTSTEHPTGTTVSPTTTPTASTEVVTNTIATTTQSGPLAFTGDNTGGHLLVGSLLIGLGLALGTRRRHSINWR